MTHHTMSPAHLAGLAALAEQTFVEGYADRLDAGLLTRYARDTFVPDLLADVASGSTEVLYAHDEGRTIGYATVRRSRTPHGPAARMDRLYVCARHHRQGHGRRLMQRGLALAASWGAARLRLGVWEENDRAIAFYEAMGFTACGEETFDLLGLSQRDVVMCRPLPTR